MISITRISVLDKIHWHEKFNDVSNIFFYLVQHELFFWGNFIDIMDSNDVKDVKRHSVLRQWRGNIISSLILPLCQLLCHEKLFFILYQFSLFFVVSLASLSKWRNKIRFFFILDRFVTVNNVREGSYLMEVLLKRTFIRMIGLHTLLVAQNLMEFIMFFKELGIA